MGRLAFRQQWLEKRLANNPFIERWETEDCADTLISSSGVVNDADETVLKEIFTLGIDKVEEKELLWLWEDTSGQETDVS